MDPRTFCKEAVAHLLAVLLAYVSEQPLSAPKFVQRLGELAGERWPAVAAAARAILLDWQGQTSGS